MGARVLQVIAVPVLVLVASPLPLLAEEPVAMTKVLRDADSYHLHSVLLKGNVRDAQVIAPFLPPVEGCSMRRAVTFFLDDETGSIQVGAQLCGNQSINNGDRVLIQALILVAHEYIDGEDRRTVAAIFQGMKPLGG